METKICTKCKIEKSIIDYNKDPQKSDGLHSQCKNCRKKERTNSIIRRERDYKLKKRYNLSLNDYEYYYHLQNGRCAICSKEDKLVVDHNHKTGKIRELLCHSCNVLIGFSRENEYILQEAINYIKRHNSI